MYQVEWTVPIIIGAVGTIVLLHNRCDCNLWGHHLSACAVHCVPRIGTHFFAAFVAVCLVHHFSLVTSLARVNHWKVKKWATADPLTHDHNGFVVVAACLASFASVCACACWRTSGARSRMSVMWMARQVPRAVATRRGGGFVGEVARTQCALPCTTRTATHKGKPTSLSVGPTHAESEGSTSLPHRRTWLQASLVDVVKTGGIELQPTNTTAVSALDGRAHLVTHFSRALCADVCKFHVV